MWKLMVPKRWFNRLLFYTGWLSLLLHILMGLAGFWWPWPMQLSLWLTVVAPVCCILWGGLPALQIQRESASSALSC